MPRGNRLALPDAADESLSEWGAGQSDWEEAPTGPVELPDGERGDAARLQVHVGQWPDASEYREDMQDFAQKVLRIQKSRSSNRRTTIQNREQLRTVTASAPPAMVLKRPSGSNSQERQSVAGE